MAIKISEVKRILGKVFTANPTNAAEAGQDVDLQVDNIGRTVTYPYAVRGSIGTTSTTMRTSGEHANNETIIIDPTSGEYHDILMVTGVNGSDQAIRLNIHENFGGSAQFRIQMAANATTQVLFQAPYNASEKGIAWYADYDVYGGVTNADDVTNTTVNVFAQYIKNI